MDALNKRLEDEPYELEIINVSRNPPDRAELVRSTPALARELPDASWQVSADLTNLGQTFDALGL
jgi:hypothetical protein